MARVMVMVCGSHSIDGRNEGDVILLDVGIVWWHI